MEKRLNGNYNRMLRVVFEDHITNNILSIRTCVHRYDNKDFVFSGHCLKSKRELASETSMN